MLYFENLNKLSTHSDYLTTIFWEKKFFFVGWLVRDLLLHRENSLEDIDITLGGTHADNKAIITHSDKDFSFFDTEKYGTMTIIPKKENNKSHYEITPFRTETTYSDGRHPDEVIRSDSLLEDSQRRDFTINCLYYTKLQADYVDRNSSFSVLLGWAWQEFDSLALIKQLERKGRYYDSNSCTLLIQDHNLIEKISGEKPYDSFSQEDISGPIVHLILDPHQGTQDLLAKKIRAVGLPDKRFQEDALRVIRGLRFSIALECDFEKHTWTSLQQNAHLLRQVAKERIKQECDKAFWGNNPFGFVWLLDAAHVLKRIFPKVYDNKGVEQPIRYHPFDVYTHTLLVLYHLQGLSTDKLLRYAALYHDVGKVEQYSTYDMKLDEEGIRNMFSSWLNHINCGEDFVREDFRFLGTSNKEIDIIAWYVHNHMKLGEILMGDSRHYTKKLRPLIAEVWPDMVKKLWLLTIADRLGQYNPIQAPQIQSVYDLIDLVDVIMEEEGRFSMKELVIDGTMLMEELQLPAWPQLGELLKRSYERVLEDLTRNDKKILLVTIKQWMEQ